MGAYRVIRHPGDEDEGARWACRALQQWGPVEIASGLTPAVLRLGRTWLFASTGGGIFLILSWQARLAGLPNGRAELFHSTGLRSSVPTSFIHSSTLIIIEHFTHFFRLIFFSLLFFFLRFPFFCFTYYKSLKNCFTD